MMAILVVISYLFIRVKLLWFLENFFIHSRAAPPSDIYARWLRHTAAQIRTRSRAAPHIESLGRAERLRGGTFDSTHRSFAIAQGDKRGGA
jgi:hypothetical protein